MSWTASVPTTPAGEFPAAVDNTPPSGPESPEMFEQVAVAKATAIALVASGAVGNATHSYSAYLSGHANGEHEPTESWANDCITVTVAQASA